MQTIMGILPLVLMVALLYFFMIRPQKKRDKEEREMRYSIQGAD
ncbi:MAG: preprotein translocase subunit YajC [Eubacteriales bacterium]|nr:preprotein translocase subunit YajC [Eubacteriales bacterium]